MEARVISKVSRRIVPFVALCYFVCYLDRVNVGFAALEMNKDLGFTGIALINSIGNLAGFAAPYAMGYLKDATGGFTAGLLAVAFFPFLSAILVLILGHNPALERGAIPEGAH